MPHGAHNWTYRDVVRFLRVHDFVILREGKGSHTLLVGTVSGTRHLVTVFYHAQKTFHPKTLKSMVRQSGIPLEQWLSE
jgi:predicted RNA binding protein YcfA (HicA-like mRNA interferase family)